MGVLRIGCQFQRGDIVRGLSLYDAASLEKIKGHRSEEIAAILGYQNSPKVVHRDDLMVL